MAMRKTIPNHPRVECSFQHSMQQRGYFATLISAQAGPSDGHRIVVCEDANTGISSFFPYELRCREILGVTRRPCFANRPTRRHLDGRQDHTVAVWWVYDGSWPSSVESSFPFREKKYQKRKTGAYHVMLRKSIGFVFVVLIFASKTSAQYRTYFTYYGQFQCSVFLMASLASILSPASPEQAQIRVEQNHRCVESSPNRCCDLSTWTSVVRAASAGRRILASANSRTAPPRSDMNSDGIRVSEKEIGPTPTTCEETRAMLCPFRPLNWSRYVASIE
jgi:hypothetical protein